jgi:RND family efflux transporter MFP subunit
VLADVTQLNIEADVDEVDAPTVQVGQSAEVRLDAFPGETLKATVRRVAPAASTRSGAVSYTAWLDPDPSQLALKPGMGATIKIATRTKTDALLLPSNAVQPVGRQKIVRLVRNGRVVETEVITGLTDKQQVEIVSGLKEGDLVVVD